MDISNAQYGSSDKGMRTLRTQIRDRVKNTSMVYNPILNNRFEDIISAVNANWTGESANNFKKELNKFREDYNYKIAKYVAHVSQSIDKETQTYKKVDLSIKF